MSHYLRGDKGGSERSHGEVAPISEKVSGSRRFLTPDTPPLKVPAARHQTATSTTRPGPASNRLGSGDLRCQTAELNHLLSPSHITDRWEVHLLLDPPTGRRWRVITIRTGRSSSDVRSETGEDEVSTPTIKKRNLPKHHDRRRTGRPRPTRPLPASTRWHEQTRVIVQYT